MKDILKIAPSDNVCVALNSLEKGVLVYPDGENTVSAEGCTNGLMVLEDIPAGHKLAVRDIKAGEAVVKYGAPIGTATENISAGSHVHIHNIKTGLCDELEYTYEPANIPAGDAVVTDCQASDKLTGNNLPSTFMGYQRGNGSVGVRNEVWIIPTVGCVNSVATKLAGMADSQKPEGIDAVVAFPHPYGCSQMGGDQENSRIILADLIHHPNAGGVLVLGLGCENSNIDVLKTYIGEYDSDRIKFLVAQETEDEIDAGIKLLRDLMATVSQDVREPVPVSKLIVGMKCGGSDGFSGITANPLVGRFSDILVGKGGTTILTEVPEMFGAETLLMNRCADKNLFEKTVKLINGFKEYFKSHGQTIYENPSPGNKKGGISTLEDKSLGCTQKSGTSLVKGVLDYGEKVTATGLNLLCAPGNDLVASTALAASGAQIVLFTTGRGTPFASPVPTVKISSNSKLAGHKHEWIDFDAGVVLEQDNMKDLSAQFYKYIIEVADGKKVSAERAGFHDMAIFKQGVTL